MTINLYVASDSAVVRAGLRAIVEGTEDLLVAGESGLDGLREGLPTVRPDILLLELPTGDRDDLELLGRLISEMPEMGVLLLSGDPGEGFARAALQAGVRGYLLRDVSPDEIIHAVRAVDQGLTVLHPATTQALLQRSGIQPPEAAGEPLSTRELGVLQLLAEGLPSKIIATRLQISEHTVKFPISSIYSRLGVNNRAEVVRVGARSGLISL